MYKLKIIIGILLIIMPLALGIIIFSCTLKLPLSTTELDRLLRFISKDFSPMTPIFYGIMLLSGVYLLNTKPHHEK